MWTPYVIAGTWGCIKIFLPAIVVFACWQLFVRYTLAGATAAVTEEPEDTD